MTKARKIALATTIVLSFVALGIVSNASSKQRAEWETAKEIGPKFTEVKQVYCSGWPDGDEAKKVFPKGIEVRLTSDAEASEQVPFPTTDMPHIGLGKARSVMPFVVSVDWMWMSGENRGAMHTCTYVSLFGAVIKVRCKYYASF